MTDYAPGEFTVWQHFSDGTCEEVLPRVSDQSALARAKAPMESVGGRIGTTARVLIADGDDYIAFEWKFGEGIVFPQRAECEIAAKPPRS